MANIWSNSYLERLRDDAEINIFVERIIQLYKRKSLAITVDVGTATIPNDVLDIIGITWLGRHLEAKNSAEMEEMSSIYRSATSGRPNCYTRGMDGLYTVRFFPIPNQTIASNDTSIFSSDNIRDRVILSYFATPDTSKMEFDLPDYLARRLLKPYVLERAFRKEGPGQNLQAAEYWKYKKEVVAKFAKDIFLKKSRSMNTQMSPTGRVGRPGRPRLADDFTINA